MQRIHKRLSKLLSVVFLLFTIFACPTYAATGTERPMNTTEAIYGHYAVTPGLNWDDLYKNSYGQYSGHKQISRDTSNPSYNRDKYECIEIFYPRISFNADGTLNITLPLKERWNCSTQELRVYSLDPTAHTVGAKVATVTGLDNIKNYNFSGLTSDSYMLELYTFYPMQLDPYAMTMAYSEYTYHSIQFFNVEVDSTPPTMIVSKSAGWGRTASIYFKATDNVAVKNVTMNNVVQTGAEGNMVVYKNGNYTWVATDTSDNTKSTTVTIDNIDTVKPKVSITIM